MGDNGAIVHEVVIGGVGGQGVLTAGRLLAEAGMSLFQHVLWFPNYAGSMRGGDCECLVVLSNEEVDSPVALNPSAAMILDRSMRQKFESRLKPGGLFILDSTVLPEPSQRSDIRVVHIPATEAAVALGSNMIANLVLLGSYLTITKAVPLALIEKALTEKLAGSRRASLLALNIQALQRGADLVA